MSTRKEQIDATNFLRSNFPYVSQRGLAEIINRVQVNKLTDYRNFDYHQTMNVRDAVIAAGDTAPLATIYGRIRRYDKIKAESQQRDREQAQAVERSEAEINNQQAVGV